MQACTSTPDQHLHLQQASALVLPAFLGCLAAEPHRSRQAAHLLIHKSKAGRRRLSKAEISLVVIKAKELESAMEYLYCRNWQTLRAMAAFYNFLK